MSGCNSLIVCHFQMNEMLTAYLNEHLFQDGQRIEVTGVKFKTHGYEESFEITLAPAKIETKPNQTSPCQN